MNFGDTPRSQTQLTTTTPSSTPPIAPQSLIDHGDSPTAIILSIAMFISIVIGSMTRLLRVIMVTRSDR